MPKKKLGPAHPGEVLLEEFLKPMGLSQSRLALSIGVHPRRVNEMVLGKRGITADTALRLAKYFGTSAKFWLGPQGGYDLHSAGGRVGGRPQQRDAGTRTAPQEHAGRGAGAGDDLQGVAPHRLADEDRADLPRQRYHRFGGEGRGEVVGGVAGE